MTDSLNPPDLSMQVLVENKAAHGLKPEHGLALWVRYGDENILFDTGQNGDTLLENSNKMQVDLSKTDAIVISHGHYDHTGGLARALEIAPEARVFIHPHAVEAKYSVNGNEGTYNGIPVSADETLKSAGITWTSAATPVIPDIFVTGEIPRKKTR